MAMTECRVVARALMIIASDHRRGAETFAVALADALRSTGDTSTVVALSGNGGRDAVDVEVMGRSRWDPRGLVRLVRLAHVHDVVVGHGSSSLLNGAAVAAIARRPFVYRNIGDPSAWGVRRGADLRIGAPLRRAASVAALYDVARSELCRRYRLDPRRVRTIPNAVDVHRFAPATSAGRSARRSALGLDPALRWVGCVGALSEEKRVHLAIDAVARIAELGLVVAGDGPERDAARRHADDVAPGRVVFLGSVPDVETVYEAIELLLLPSRTEGLPAVVIEASLCCVPVVAAPVGGLPEVVVDGVTGVLADPADGIAFDRAITEALSRSAELGAAARRHAARRFSMESVSEAWSALLDDVTASGGRRATRGT